jgi:hypothetical protein
MRNGLPTLKTNGLAFLSALTWIITFSFTANAANWYVRPSAHGANNGADWNNAWSISSIRWSNVQPGDTIWLAGGTYSSEMIVGASGTSTAPINIWRATSNDKAVTSSPGWSSAFDSQVVCNTDNWPQWWIQGPTSYVNIDGRTSSGILIQEPPQGGDMFRIGNGTGNITGIWISHLELVGSASTSGLNAGRYGFNLVPGQYGNQTLTNSTIDHCIVHQICEAFRANNWNGVTVQYCSIHDTTLDNIDHNDFCYASGSILNTIWRYNTFYNSPSDGLLFETDTALTGFYFYGNVCYNCVYAIIQTKSSTNHQTLNFYNNVFAGQGSGSSNFAYLSLQGNCSGCQIYDNIFYNCQNQYPDGGVTSGYNAYYPSSVSGVQPPGEAGSFLLSSLPFTNAIIGSFTLSSLGVSSNPNLSNGLTLASDGYINYDMAGNLRGNPWYIGAFQFASSSPTPSPTPTPTPKPTPTPTPTPTPVSYSTWENELDSEMRSTRIGRAKITQVQTWMQSSPPVSSGGSYSAWENELYQEMASLGIGENSIKTVEMWLFFNSPTPN